MSNNGIAIVKTVCGGSVLLVDYKNLNFPTITLNGAIDLSALVIASTTQKAPFYNLVFDKESDMNLSFFTDKIPNNIMSIKIPEKEEQKNKNNDFNSLCEEIKSIEWKNTKINNELKDFINELKDFIQFIERL